jgi:hypothetical protein
LVGIVWGGEPINITYAVTLADIRAFCEYTGCPCPKNPTRPPADLPRFPPEPGPQGPPGPPGPPGRDAEPPPISAAGHIVTGVLTGSAFPIIFGLGQLGAWLWRRRRPGEALPIPVPPVQAPPGDPLENALTELSKRFDSIQKVSAIVHQIAAKLPKPNAQ